MAISRRRIPRYAVILGLLLCVPLSYADGFDYSASFGARSLPSGASLFGNVGYGFQTWGENGKDQFLYGYLRPDLRIAASGFVNAADLGLEIYPVSFFGFRFGKSKSFRNVDLDTLDCNRVECRGVLDRNLFEAKLTLGYGQYFIQANEFFEDQSPSIKRLPYADENESISGRNGGDHLLKTEVILGRQFDSGFIGGFHIDHAETMATHNFNSEESAIVGYQKGKWTTIGGAGRYQSSTQAADITVFFLVKWMGIQKLGF